MYVYIYIYICIIVYNVHVYQRDARFCGGVGTAAGRLSCGYTVKSFFKASRATY